MATIDGENRGQKSAIVASFKSGREIANRFVISPNKELAFTIYYQMLAFVLVLIAKSSSGK